MKKKLTSILFISTLLLCGCGDSSPTPSTDTYYTVSYLSGEGTGRTIRDSVKENTEYTLKECPFTPPSEKVFSSWLIDNTSYLPGDKITVTSDLSVKATYISEGHEDVYYTITYLPNGGTGNAVIESILENTEYTIKEFMFTAPSEKEFNSWVIDNKTYYPGDKITITGDTDILATYKDKGESEKTYTVTFNPGLGTGYMEPIVIEEGFSIQLPTCTFTPPLGKVFYRWGDDIATYKEKAYVTINEDIEFTAYYIDNGKDVYTVSFSSNGGSGSMSDVQVEEGLYTLPECTFTPPTSKVFDYWSISSSSTKYQPGNQINVTGNVTVTTNWKNIVATKYTLTYYPNGGTGSMPSETAEENTWVYLAYNSFTAPSGKEFDYWRIGSSSYAEHQAIKVTSNLSIYAEWKTKEDTPSSEWEDDKVYLDCGYYNMGIPSNEDDPVEVPTSNNNTDAYWFKTKFEGDVDNGYRYIYKNSCSDGPSGHKCSVSTYAVSHDGGGLKIDGVGIGFGSPYFTHEGKKLEIRFGVSSVNKSSDKKQTGKDTYHVYFFDKDNKYLGKSVVSERTISTKTEEFKVYYSESNCSQVRFFEFRCNALPYVESKCYNIGISSCDVKSWPQV